MLIHNTNGEARCRHDYDVILTVCPDFYTVQTFTQTLVLSILKYLWGLARSTLGLF